jgi:hypothetical protein
MKFLSLFALALFSSNAVAQTAPELSSWVQNMTGKTGYGGIESNVQRVQYSDSFVYVSCTCIPGYDIGPWKGNPNTPKNQNFVFKITRHPQANSGTLTATPLGHIGIWSNGVSIFNAKDAHSYNNAGIWNQNAIVVEGSSFDECLGHPAPNGEYHHHLNPVCLYNDKDSTHHSPIIGYAFDGYPIYGAYGYSVVTEDSQIVSRMRSSYRLRNITDRTTLANGTKLSASQYGPAISTQYPLGYYLEDFEYVPGFGDLDSNNGRFCVTPEYPHGTYAYFVTIDAKGSAVYPYTFGPNYHGVVTTVDVGPGSGHVTVSEPVLQYTGSNASVKSETTGLSVYPNPTSDWLVVDYSSTNDYVTSITITDLRGSTIYSANASGPTTYIPVTNLASGAYFVRIVTSTGAATVRKLVKD